MNLRNRRDLLLVASSLGALPLGATLAGEPEYGRGGTIARLVDLGHPVVLLYLDEGVPLGKPKDGARVAEAGRAREHSERFAKLIEAEAPEVVFTHWQALGRRFALYYHEVSDGEETQQFAPNHYAAIISTESRKRRACLEHASQSPATFYAMREQVTRFRGIERGCRHAEGFIRHVRSPDFPLPSSR